MPGFSATFVTLCSDVSNAWAHFAPAAFAAATFLGIIPANTADVALDEWDGFRAIKLTTFDAGSSYTAIRYFVALDAPATGVYDSRLLGAIAGFSTSYQNQRPEPRSDYDMARVIAFVNDSVRGTKEDLLTSWTDAVSASATEAHFDGPNGWNILIATSAAWLTSTGALQAMDRMTLWFPPQAEFPDIQFDTGENDVINVAVVAATGVDLAPVTTVLEQIANKDTTVSINQNAAAWSIEGQVDTET